MKLKKIKRVWKFNVIGNNLIQIQESKLKFMSIYGMISRKHARYSSAFPGERNSPGEIKWI